MKQTSNAIKFLLAQYRSIFKNAYFKGLATAVVVTAGLAAGAAQAANTWYIQDGATWTPQQSYTSSASGAAGAYETDTGDSDGVAGSVTKGQLTIGASGTAGVDVTQTSVNAYGGYIVIGSNTIGTASAVNNHVTLQSSGAVLGHLIGGWAKHTGNGAASASENVLTLNTTGSGSVTFGSNTQLIGGYASSLHNASASNNIININDKIAVGGTKFNLDKNIYGGMAGADVGANSEIYTATGNSVYIDGVILSGSAQAVAGGYVLAWGQADVQNFTATGNTVDVKNASISATNANSGAIFAANMVDVLSRPSATVDLVTVSGSDNTGLIISNTDAAYANLVGAWATNKGSIAATANRVVLDEGTDLSSGSNAIGAYLSSVLVSGDATTLTSNANSVTLNGAENKEVSIVDGSVFGTQVIVSSGTTTTYDLLTVNASNNKLVANADTSLSLSDRDSASFVGAHITSASGTNALSGASITANNNSVEFNGTFTGSSDRTKNLIGAALTDFGLVNMRNNSTTVAGKVANATIFGAFNGSKEDNGSKFIANLSDNSVTIGKDAEISSSNIYAAYGQNVSTTSLNNKVNVSGKLTDTNIYGGAGAGSIVTLDNSSSFTVTDTGTSIRSDVVNIAGTVTVNTGADLTIGGYATNGQTEAGSGYYNPNSTTIAASTTVYNAGTLNLNGMTEVADGAKLYATNTNGQIVVNAKAANIDTYLYAESDVFSAFVNDGETVLSIADDTLKTYLDGGVEYTSNLGTTLETTQGKVSVVSGGGIDFRDSVVLSDFNFTDSNEAGKIQIDKNTQNGGSIFKADEVTIEHKLAGNATQVHNPEYDLDYNDLSEVNTNTNGVIVEANVLRLGTSDLSSKRSSEIHFAEAIVKDEIYFNAAVSGTDPDYPTDKNNGYRLTSAVTGSNYMETQDQNSKQIYYTALDSTIHGDVTVTSNSQSGSLSIDHGNWTALDSVTVDESGSIAVGGDWHEGVTADATLTLNQGLTFSVDSSSDSGSVTVSGNGTGARYDFDAAAETVGDDALALLDLRNGLTMVGDDNLGIQGKATITATNGGVVLLDSRHVNTILSQNDKVKTKSDQGAFFSGSNGGAFIITGDVAADFDDFDTTKNGFNLSSNGYLVADSLTVNNEGDTKDTAQDEKGYTFNSVSFGGNVVVDDLNVSDLQTTTGTSKPNVDSQYASYVTIMNGTAHVANSVTSINDTLVLGSGTDTGVNAAHIVLDSSLTTDQGTVNVDNLRVDNGSVRVTNGTWDATATTFNLNSATASMTIGGGDEEDEAGNDTFAILNADALRMAQGSRLVVEADGEATFARADLSSLTTQQTNDGITVYGSLTINGDTSATIASGDTTVDDPRNGVAFGAEGSIIIGNNGVLKFGKAATTGAIIAPATDSRYNDAAEVTASMVKGYSKINNNGGELHLGLGSGTVFSAEAILQLKNELFTAGSMTGGVLNHGGVLNIGDASFEGITNPVAFEGPGRSGYTATWDSVKKFSDVYGTDVANNTLTQTNISGIKVGDAIQGNWGSLRMSTDADTGAKVTIAGNTSLRFAEGNNGFFISNDSSSAALGANVQCQKSLTLQNGGTIGAVTLQEGQDNVEKNLTTLKVKGAGETTIASVNGVTNSGTVGSNATRLYVTGANNLTTVTGDITNVAYVDVEDGAALTAANVSVDELNTINSTITITNKAEFDNSYVLGGKISVKDAVYTNENIVGNSHNYDDFVIVNGGTFTAETFKFQRASQLNVGADLTAEEATLEDGTVMTGTGYFEAQVLELNDGRLVVDPAYGELTSVAAIGKFQADDRQTYKYANDKGVVEGSLLVGKNAVLGVGASIAETLDAISTYQENGSLSADKYGSILYLNGQLTLGNSTSEIALNANADVSTVDGIRDSLKYTVSANELDREADLGLGANTAILMTEQAFEDDKGDKTGVAITFNRNNAVVNGAGGEIVLVGSFDAAQPLNFFKDNDAAGSEGVSIQGSIKVYTQNGFLFTTLEGENAGYGERLEVDTDRAYQVMSDASDPVVASLISYHVDRGGAVAGEDNSQESGASIPASKLTPAAKTSSGTLASRSGPILGGETGGDAGTGGDTDSGSDAGNGGTGGDAGTTNPGHKLAGSSTFLNEVVTTSHGAPAEAVARMALYGGAVQAAIAANTSSYEAIAARTGVGATDMGLTVANNGMGASLWLAPMYKNQDSDSFDAEGLSYGVDMNLYGVALGADFEFMPGLTAGIMFNVGSGSADGQGNAAASSVSSDFDYYGISVYGNYKYDALSITADLGYTAVDSDIDAQTGLDSYGSVSTSVDSTAWTLGVTSKYTFNVGGVELAPHAGLRYSSIDLDDYSVSDIASYDADTMDIFSIPVGVTIAKEFSGEAWTVKPSLDLSVQGNFGDDTSDGTVHWTGVDGLATNVSSEMMDNFTYGATLGVSAQTGSFSMGLGVNYTGSDNVDEFGVNANARFVF